MQRVNLFTDDFKPKKVVLPLWQIATLPIVCTLLLAVVSYFAQSSAEQLAQDVQRKQEQAKRLSTQVEALAKRTGSLVRDESLVAANERLKQRLLARESMLGVLESVVVEEDEGFSEVLVALARQRADELWLDHIQISGPERSYGLKGKTRKAQSVPAYLQSLREEEVFVGHSFNLFDLSSDKQRSGELQFTLQSKSLHAGGKSASNLFSHILNKTPVSDDG